MIEERVYKYEFYSLKNEKLVDYIQLTYNNGSITGGKYYGNREGFSFMAHMKFDSFKKDSVSFVLIDYLFTEEKIAPYLKTTKYTELNELPFELKEEIKFRGAIAENYLNIERVMWYFDSQSDKMLFNLIE